MTNIEDLRSRLKSLLALLDNPEPGLFSWHMNYRQCANHVLSFWGLSLADSDAKSFITKTRKMMNEKLEHVASACESGGHKSRAKMFRAVAKELDAALEAELKSST